MLTNWPLRGSTLVGSIDEVTVVGGELAEGDAIPCGAYVALRGWLLNRAGQQPDGLEVEAGNGHHITLVRGFPRPDVAANLQTNVVDAGVYGVGAITLPPGEYVLAISARFDDELVPLESGVRCKIAVPVDPLAGSARRDDGWVASIDGFFRGEERLAADPVTGATRIDPDRPASLRVWCVDTRTGTTPVALIARMGGCYLSVVDGYPRADVAEHLHMPEAERCGYAVPALPPLAGTGQIELFPIFADGTYAVLPPSAIEFPDPVSSRTLPDVATLRAEIDEMCVGERTLDVNGEIVLWQSETLRIRGWAIDATGPRLTGAIEAHLNGVRVALGRRSGPRRDIAAYIGHSALLDCEFVLDVSGADLETGIYELVVWGLSARFDARGPIAVRMLRVSAAPP